MIKLTSALLIALAVSLATAPTLALADLQDGIAAYRRKNYDKAYVTLLPVAQHGDVEAQRLVGYLYLHGRGTTEDKVEAFKWFKLAADQGDAESMRRLGGILVQGRGVAQDLHEAVKWFRRADAALTQPIGPSDTGEFAWTRPAEALSAFANCKKATPAMPAQAIQNGAEGTVKAQLLMDQGVARDVVILSGPKIFHDAVTQALIRYDCSPQKISVLATQEFVFAMDEKGVTPRPNFSISLREPAFKSEEPPFNGDWYGLNSAQKMLVRGQYQNMTAEDEPPYPSQGLAEIAESIRLGAEQLSVQGILRLDVKIGSNGKVESVSVLTTPDPQLSKYAASAIYRASYKAALCAKQACAMNLPIDVVITRNLVGGKSAAENEFNIFRDAAQTGDATAQNDVGERLEGGIGTAKDTAQAIQWYQQSAAQGNKRAQMNLARAYSAGVGVAKDRVQALQWFRKAAEQGDYGAQTYLATVYMYGRGVDKDMGEAVQWLQKAADQGYAPAQNNLADAYENGRGVAVDLAQALKWYSLAADQRERVAMFSLAHMYADGRGVTQDQGRALRLLQDAADLGYPKAQFDLAQAYAQGKGVDKDVDLALKWYRRAAKYGNKDAAAKLAELGVKS